MPTSISIVHALLAARLIGGDQLCLALYEQRHAHRPFGQICMKLRHVIGPLAPATPREMTQP
ncbi:MAG: hypothetical protein LBP58_10810 [Azoarcus sp.]|nr:hypothetical protein [Azoarcus sp.]